jgi:hypothetical protein
MNLTLRIAAGAALLAALAGCDRGAQAPACPDITITDACKARCSRAEAQPDGALKVCARQLMVKEASRNDILQSDIQQVQTRKLPAEECFSVAGDKISDAAARERLEGLCKTP